MQNIFSFVTNKSLFANFRRFELYTIQVFIIHENYQQDATV